MNKKERKDWIQYDCCGKISKNCKTNCPRHSSSVDMKKVLEKVDAQVGRAVERLGSSVEKWKEDIRVLATPDNADVLIEGVSVLLSRADQAGYERGRTEEAIGCEEHCKKAEEEMLKKVMGCVPERKEYPFYNGRHNPDGGTSGWNYFREVLLSRLAALSRGNSKG